MFDDDDLDDDLDDEELSEPEQRIGPAIPRLSVQGVGLVAFPLLPVPDERVAVQAVADALRGWEDDPGGPGELVWVLDHGYSSAELCCAVLKGQDAARAGVLRAAAAEAGVDVHLSMICIDESGWAQHNGRWGDDDDNFEVGEVDDSRRRLDGWRDRGDRVLGLGELPLDDHEIWPAGALEGVEPDEVSFSEATGNEGASFDRAYRVAAVVLWPGARRYEVRAAPEAATPLRALALALLDDRLRVPPAPYSDMARPAEVGCACEDCAALARFLLHPVRARWELKAAKYAREHVEARVKRAVLDLDLATVTRGSPHTLVCTKNSASHERRVAQRERDLAWRRALGG